MCGEDHQIQNVDCDRCESGGSTRIEDNIRSQGRSVVDFDDYPEFVKNPGCTVSDHIFDETFQYRRFYRAATGHKSTPWGSERDSAREFFQPIMGYVDKLPRRSKKTTGFTKEEQEIIKSISQDFIGSWTLRIARVTTWIVFSMVMTVLMIFIACAVK